MNRSLIPLFKAANRLGVSIHTVRKWLYQRRLPSYKLGGRVLLDECEVEIFIETNRIPSRNEEPR